MTGDGRMWDVKWWHLLTNMASWA